MRRSVCLLALLLAGCGAAAAPPEPPAVSAPHFLPTGGADTPAAPRVQAPARPAGRYLIARLKRPVQLRSTPGGRRLARIATRTEFGSRTLLSVVRRRPGWLQVVAKERPNGRRGWIPDTNVRLSGTDYSVHVDRSARRLTLRHGDRVVRRLPVAVGRPANPTPTGRYAVTDLLRPARADSPYGCCILALTGHQTKLVPGWPGGDRLAIHATPQADSVGRAVSLGCMRAHSRDVEFLLRRVPIGAPVFIRA